MMILLGVCLLILVTFTPLYFLDTIFQSIASYKINKRLRLLEEALPFSHREGAKMTKPITPKEAAESKVETIPDFVIEAFNELIVAGLRGGNSTVYQRTVVTKILEKAPAGTSRQDIFNRGWLDVEGLYRQAGWRVTYDKAEYNEDYPSIFVFSQVIGSPA